MASPTSNMARNILRTSKRLVLSYIIDWIFIVAIAALGVVFNRISASNKRTFVLQDPSITYPYKEDTVTITVAAIVALVVPAGVMFILCMLVVPGAGAPRGTPQSLVWRRKLWEWNTAWMGLALSCAAAFMLTEGLKDLGGKPRPHMLAVCRPNLSQIATYQVGGIGSTLTDPIPIMVSSDICQETNPKKLRDAFASWPSGHSSFAFAGLLYFTLFLSAKFAVTIPFLNPISFRKQQTETPSFPNLQRSKTQLNSGLHSATSDSTLAQIDHNLLAPRNQAAAPPIFLLILVFIPLGAAIFIAVSRWFDYHHFAFDIISGSLLGIFTSWFSFRLYHMPIRRGAGWSWGARSRDRAFWIGVGRETYVGTEGWEAQRYDAQRDVELRDLEKARHNQDVDIDVSHAKHYDHPADHGRQVHHNASIETERMPLNQSHPYHTDSARLHTDSSQVGQAV